MEIIVGSTSIGRAEGRAHPADSALLSDAEVEALCGIRETGWKIDCRWVSGELRYDVAASIFLARIPEADGQYSYLCRTAKRNYFHFRPAGVQPDHPIDTVDGISINAAYNFFCDYQDADLIPAVFGVAVEDA